MVASLGGLFPFWCPAFGEIKYVVVVVFVSTDEQIETAALPYWNA